MKGSWRSIFVAALFVIFSISFYRPLPQNFTDTAIDRTIMYFLEAVLRFTLVYPVRLCPDAYCQLRWNRIAVGFLLRISGPWTSYDAQLDIETVEFDSVLVRVYVPRFNRSSNGAVVFIHGGGFVLGNIEMYESVMRKFTKDVKTVTISVEYRLAPEHRFPMGLDDCERAVVYLLKHAYATYDVDPTRVALMGDSAGGGLVASLTHRLRHRSDIPPIKAQVLVYPLLQLVNTRTPSYERHYREMDGTAFIEPYVVAQYYLMYAGIDIRFHNDLTRITLNNGHVSASGRQIVEEFVDISKLPSEFRERYNNSVWSHNEEAARLLSPYFFNPEFSPLLRSNLSGLPCSLIVTCEYDILRDEGVLYAARLKESGVQTKWKHFSTGFHALINFHSTLGTARRAIEYIAEWVRKNI